MAAKASKSAGGPKDPNNPFGYPQEDVEQGKLLAILSYIIPLVSLVPLIQKDNHFSLFHAKQVLLLAICDTGLPGAVLPLWQLEQAPVTEL